MNRSLTIGLVLAVVLVSGRASAQTSDADREAALELFEEGVAEYREGDFERSAELMRQAYALYEEPLLLYNLARALEQIGETEEAIEKYEAYLREEPDAEDRGAVERRLEILRERLAEEREDEREQAQPAPSVASPPQQTAPAPPAAGEETSAADTASSPSPAPWIVAGAGVAVVAAGGVFGALAQKAHDDAVDDPVHRSAAASERDADRWALLANVAFAVGGAAAVVGAVWGIVDLMGGDGESEHAVSVRVGPGGLGVTGRF